MPFRRIARRVIEVTHGHAFEVVLHLSVFICTFLIDIYEKTCKRLDDHCHGIHGNGMISLQLFKDMLEIHVFVLHCELQAIKD